MQLAAAGCAIWGCAPLRRATKAPHWRAAITSSSVSTSPVSHIKLSYSLLPEVLPKGAGNFQLGSAAACSFPAPQRESSPAGYRLPKSGAAVPDFFKVHGCSLLPRLRFLKDCCEFARVHQLGTGITRLASRGVPGRLGISCFPIQASTFRKPVRSFSSRMARIKFLRPPRPCLRPVPRRPPAHSCSFVCWRALCLQGQLASAQRWQGRAEYYTAHKANVPAAWIHPTYDLEKAMPAS